MNNPTSVPTASPEPTPEVVATATKLVHAKALVKNLFIKVGVPVLIGVAAATVVARRSELDDAVDESILTDW